MLRRILARTGRTDRGSALLAVLGVFAVFLIVGATVAAVTLNALDFTSDTRASVQADAAAEAGVDSVAAQLLGGSCPAGASLEGSDIDFSATVYTSSSATQPSTWPATPSCPDGSTRWVRIVSAGSAAGTTGGQDTQKVEAVYPYTPSSSFATGSAAYSYQAGTFNNGTIGAPGEVTNVTVHDAGSGQGLSCVNMNVHGSIVAGAGNISIESSCTVEGSVSAGGMLTVQDGKIGGDAVAGSTSATNQISPGSRIGGALRLAGHLSTWSVPQPCGGHSWDSVGYACGLQAIGAVGGSYTVEDPSVVTPQVPNWVDYSFVPSRWALAGYAVKQWTGSCTIDNTASHQTLVRSLADYGSKVVVDARSACPGGVLISNSASLNLTVKNDFAIIAPTFGIEGLRLKSDGPQRQVRFITPDTVADHKPTCAAGSGAIDINSSVHIDRSVSAFIYSPCTIKNSANSWNGQMYAGKVNIDSDVTVLGAPIGLVDMDIDTGETTHPTGGALGDRVILRDIKG